MATAEICHKPPATAARPAATVNFSPMERAMIGDNRAAKTSMSAIGRIRSPAWSGELPSSNWRNCVCKNSAPSSPKVPRLSATKATEKRRSEKNVSFNIG